MAARAYESEIDLSVWRYGGQCPTCTGILKYKYYNLQKPGVELHVMPNKKRFEVVEMQMINNRKKRMIVLQGPLIDIKVLLQSV